MNNNSSVFRMMKIMLNLRHKYKFYLSFALEFLPFGVN
jgi:hypothetical protein